MTTIDPYTSLTNQEFLRLHGDRIPEDLLPRIESLLDSVSKDKYEDLQMEYSNLEEENTSLKNDAWYLTQKSSDFERKLKASQEELESVRTRLRGICFD